MKRVVIYILFFLVFALNTEAQCAMCRAVLESGEGQTAAEGINDGIVYLMAIPYVLVGGLGYLIYRKFNTSK
ncbi:membrane protein [Gaetbulibacter saemankumensis]|uniref:membrane protein n=1 Tax=Gaetbulibacter saemankumensis TaxID=311208 RepID=UPI0004815AAD|nr:membrane protein [Gaetbulibacter saemankumensis]